MKGVAVPAALAWMVVATPAVAHGTGGGGGSEASFPLLLIGIAVVTGGFSYRQKLPVVAFLAIVAAGVALGVGSLFVGGSQGRPDVHIAVTAPAEGATVPAGQPVTVEVAVDGPLASDPADKEGGHLHLSVDGKLQQMPYAATTEVTLEPGRHQLTVEYVDNRHLSYDPPIEAEVEVTAS